MYNDIVADPPDPDFERSTVADVESFASFNDTEADDALAALEQARAYGVAHRMGVERRDGALAEDEAGWAAFHAQLGERA